MQVSDLIERFLGHHRRHHSAATVRYYRLGTAWLGRDFGGREWNSLDRDKVIAAMDRANCRPDGTPWQPDTIRRNIVAAEQTQKFGQDQYDLDPILRPRDLKKPPGKKREDIPSQDELDAIMQAAAEKSDALELAFRSLAASGMRPNELCSAQISDLNQQRDLLVLAEHKTARKTGKPKRIPFGPTLKSLVTIATADRTAGPIWLDDRENAWTVGKLSRSFRVIKRRVGANAKLVLYSLRHWKGTYVTRKHGIYAAKEILGHSQITTTERYAHPEDDDARRWQE